MDNFTIIYKFLNYKNTFYLFFSGKKMLFFVIKLFLRKKVKINLILGVALVILTKMISEN